MVYEYEVLMVAGHPGGILMSKSIQGWELVSAVSGGFDQDNRYHNLAHTLYLRRPKEVEEESRPAASAAGKANGTKGGKANRR